MLKIEPLQIALIRDDGTEPPDELGYRRINVYGVENHCGELDLPAIEFPKADGDWGMIITVRVIRRNGLSQDFDMRPEWVLERSNQT